ncbi:glycosyltransferase family 2 protein [Aeoliella sp. SH292]|uniref:glycosyltransferase family 2 protein n=1 Tax=Aeoliella sp. SH292 TaxID=3454464 RepID=UPI003F99F794
MRTTCLVNNYNYSQYVVEAVDSALGQSLPFDEIVVVDDGSTDDSLRVLRQHYAGERRVEIVAKENGGQLSAFNAGMAHATGDVLFFLDADDRYRPQYTQQAIECYETQGIDFAIAGVEAFGPAMKSPRRKFPARNRGYSVLAALLAKKFVGGPTSSLSMRRSIASFVLPCPFEADWRTRADDVLVLGASIAGGRKYQMPGTQIDYRVHGQNHFAGQRPDMGKKLRHGLAVNRLVEWYARESGYNVAEAAAMLHREFQTIEQPSFREWMDYLSMSWRSKLPLGVRARHLGETTQYFLQQRFIRGGTASSAVVADAVLALPHSNAGEKSGRRVA